MPLLLVMAMGPLLAAEAAWMEGSARAETRGATAPPGSTSSQVLAQTQLDAAIGFGFDVSTFRVHVGYAPRVIFDLTPVQGSPTSDLLHSGDLIVDYQYSPIDRFRFDETFAYGQQNFSPLVANRPGVPPPPLDPQTANLSVLAYLSSKSVLGYDRALTPRLNLKVSTAYSLSGGADDIARKTLPLVHGVDLASTLGWSVSPQDQISGTVDAAVSRFADGSQYVILNASAGWLTQLGRFTRADVALGGGASSSQGAKGTEWTPGLLVSAGISQDVPVERQQLTGALRGSVSSTVDRFGAGIYQLAEATASVGYSPWKEIRLGGTAGLSRALSGAGQAGATVARGDLNISVAVLRQVSFAVGGRLIWQQTPVADANPVQGSQWAGYVSLNYADRGAF